MGVVKRARADPSHDGGEGDIDVYEATVTLDSSGEADSETVNFDEEFDAAPTVVSIDVTDANGSAYQSALSASSIDVDIDGGPASTEVTYCVTVMGTRGGV